MKLEELHQLVADKEPDLAKEVYKVIHTFSRDHRSLHLALTQRFKQQCKKGKLWQSKALLTAMKNAEYGFDPQLARSPGGRDGIFLLDRTFKPKNAMMVKLFDQFLDHPQRGVAEIAEVLECEVEDFKPVRLVSHHLRLLGILWQAESADWLILVDYDQTK